MRKTTLLVTFAALAFAAGGCNKKKDDAPKKTPPATTNPTPTPTPTPATPTPPPPPPKPVTLNGADLAKRFIECHAAFSAADQAKFKDCYAKDATSRFADSMMPELKGADAVVKGAMEFHAAFPDGKTEPQLVLVNGRNVASVVLFTGTNSAPMHMGPQEMPATNKKVGQLLLHMVTFDDANQVTDEWWVMDDGSFGGQLGMNPKEAPPGRPVMEKGMDGAPLIVVAADNDAEKAAVAGMQAEMDAFNKHDSKTMSDMWSDTVIESDQASPANVTGKKNVEAGLKMFWTAFPDAKITPLKSWAAGDYVVAVSTFTGTNTGNMGKMKKTGKPVSLTIAEVVQTEGGKVKELWRFYNSAAMAMQLGMMKPPEGMGAGSGSAASPSGQTAGSATH